MRVGYKYLRNDGKRNDGKREGCLKRGRDQRRMIEEKHDFIVGEKTRQTKKLRDVRINGQQDGQCVESATKWREERMNK